MALHSHAVVTVQLQSFISLPRGTLPFKVGECPCKITFWLRFRKLSSWGAIGMGQRREGTGHRTNDKGLRGASTVCTIMGRERKEPLESPETLLRAQLPNPLQSMTHLRICCGGHGETCRLGGSSAEQWKKPKPWRNRPGHEIQICRLVSWQ